MKIFILSLLIFVQSFSQQVRKETGTLTGLVVDAETGQPIFGVNVIIMNTFLGSATNHEGKFTIKNIPPGKYKLRFSAIGYETKLIDLTMNPGEEIDLKISIKPTAYAVEPVLVTATRREQRLSEVPVSSTVVESDIISTRNNLQIDDVLRYVSGVNMIQYQVNIRGSSGYSRGTGTRVLLLFDGAPFLTGDAGEIIWEAIPVWQIERIEVIKGAGSALYGSNAIGGVINVITKETSQEKSIRFRTYLGVYDKPYYQQWRWSPRYRFYYGGFTSFNGTIGKIGTLIHLQRSIDEGYKQNQNYHRWNLFSKFKYNISPYSNVNLIFNYIRQKNETFFYWKNLSNALIPRDEDIGAMVSSERFNISAQYKEILTSKFFYIVRASFFRNKWSDNGTPQNKSTAGLTNFETQFNYQPNERHLLIFGADGSINIVKSTLFRSRNSHSIALYIQDEFKSSEKLNLTFGLRGDLYKLDTLKYTGQINPKFSAVYKLTQTSNLRLSFGTGFRAPAISEAFTSTTAAGVTVKPNPSLKPERAISFETGLRFIHLFAMIDLAVFWNHYWNLIEPVFDVDGKIFFKNVTEARIQGLEISANLFPLSPVNLSLGYTYLFPWDLSEKAILRYRPKHIFYANANAGYKLFTIGADFRFISKYERIDELLKIIVPDAEERVPIYVVDARVGFNFSKLKILFNINNLLQYNYVEIVGNLAPIRNLNLSIEYEL
ncbi:iron complex outermembrane recepter protein [Candidatus Thermokryptus mobilis]|uniref:Iron complex outermembrane recepter protein n=1 Tax=Candidatus Thermokryptus mobilis TaxID=1643428 RepID=A0A0S4N8X8_9BACT|nr:TonB-dependent receptor [Candidatus Thermokryptus mobilis]CUU07614.1 iron complex outermembrane recepter protein [Candidatus Thermokryptus mobilis]